MCPSSRMALWVVLGSVAAGCAEVSEEDVKSKSTALYQQVHTLFVPAYFAQDSVNSSMPDWNALGEDPDEVGYVVANAGRDWNGNDNQQPYTSDHLVHGGPGFRDDPTRISDYVKARMRDVNYTGICTYGYVDFYPGRDAQEIQDDIDAWVNQYGVCGIFFDDAARDQATQGGIGRARYFAGVVRAAHGYSIFNWGGISNYTEGFVYCTVSDSPAVLFVTAEVDQYHYFNDDAQYNYVQTYNTPSLQDWLYTYSPWHFIHLIHHMTPDGSMVRAVMDTAAQRNAQQVYMTDLPNPNDPSDPANPWKYLSGHNRPSQFDNFWKQVVESRTTMNYPGVSPDSPRVWPGVPCPAPTPTEGGPGT